MPIKRDLSDVIEKIAWAKENDARVKEIVSNARAFVEANLLPQHIYCYHMILFKEWSNRLVAPIDVLQGMEKLNSSYTCSCKQKQFKDEL